jgi:hypothetical protein
LPILEVPEGRSRISRKAPTRTSRSKAKAHVTARIYVALVASMVHRSRVEKDVGGLAAWRLDQA